METTIHLVMETPGAHAYQILSEATQEDEPKPIFIFPKNQQENQLSGKSLTTIQPWNYLSKILNHLRFLFFYHTALV